MTHGLVRFVNTGIEKSSDSFIKAYYADTGVVS